MKDSFEIVRIVTIFHRGKVLTVDPHKIYISFTVFADRFNPEYSIGKSKLIILSLSLIHI